MRIEMRIDVRIQMRTGWGQDEDRMSCICRHKFVFKNNVSRVWSEWALHWSWINIIKSLLINKFWLVPAQKVETNVFCCDCSHCLHNNIPLAKIIANPLLIKFIITQFAIRYTLSLAKIIAHPLRLKLIITVSYKIDFIPGQNYCTPSTYKIYYNSFL